MGITKDKILVDIERCLCCGEFIAWNEEDVFVEGLRSTKKHLDALVKNKEATRAVELYEVFLAGCEEKMDEMGGECLAITEFFHELFISWIHARQKAGLDPQETISQALRMMEHDDYGLCDGIEEEIARHIKGEEFLLFVDKVHALLDEALLAKNKNVKESHHSWAIRKNAEILKAIALVKGSVKMYRDVAQKVGFTPKDCEELARIYMKRSQWSEALEYVNQGLELEKMRGCGYDAAYELSSMKCELLKKTGQSDEALKMAWDSFGKCPGEYYYQKLMQYVPATEKDQWHLRAMELTYKKGDLGDIIDLCVETNELKKLEEAILGAQSSTLEGVFYGRLQDAAQKLSSDYPIAAAKIYRVLGMNILNAKKSKCYGYARDYFKKVQELYLRAGQEREWLSLVEYIFEQHFKKSAFMPGFKAMVNGEEPKKKPSFLTRAQQHWKDKVLEKTNDSFEGNKNVNDLRSN